MGDANDVHDPLAIIHEVHGAIVADPNPIPLHPFQLDRPSRARLVFQSEEPLPDLSRKSEEEPIELALRPGCEANGVGHHPPGFALIRPRRSRSAM